MQEERKFMGVKQLTLRSLIIGAIGSGIITASSMYAALKLGMVPWPTIFAAIVSIAILRCLGIFFHKTTKNEINIAQTSMTAGSMIAAGIGFTLPGLWATGKEIKMSSYFLVFCAVSTVRINYGIVSYLGVEKNVT